MDYKLIAEEVPKVHRGGVAYDILAKFEKGKAESVRVAGGFKSAAYGYTQLKKAAKDTNSAAQVIRRGDNLYLKR